MALPYPSIEMTDMESSEDEAYSSYIPRSTYGRTFFIDTSSREVLSSRRPRPLSNVLGDGDSGKIGPGWHNDNEDSLPSMQGSNQPKRSAEEVEEICSKDEKVAAEEREYPGWRTVIPVMLSLYITMFLVALDGTIIATAIPSITDQFQSVADVGWYGSMYMMMRCSFVLVFGKLYSFYNPKWVLLSAVMWFEIGSVLCGAAPLSSVLIVGRAAAGVGAAGIFTGAIVAVKFLFPLDKRPIIMGLLGLTFTLSTVLGPLIGGALTDNLSWRWCFYINLPFGGIGILTLIFFLNLPSPEASDRPITLKQQLLKLDLLGFITFVPSIICLLLALEWGGTKYAWSDPIMIALLTLFAFLFTCFVGIQLWLQENGTVPPRIIKQRSIACAFWFSIAGGGTVTTVAYYLPLWFQAIEGISATQSGVNVLPNAIATMIGSISCGILTSRIGYYVPFMISGPIFMAVGSGLLSTLTPNSAFANRVAYQVVYGLGSGGGSQQASVAAQTVLNDQDVAIGAALMMFGTMLGSSVFISVGQNVFATTLLQGLEQIAGLDYGKVLQAGATEIRAFLSGSVLQTVIDAYNNAVTRIFFVTLGLACAALLGSLGMEWKSVKKNKKSKKRNNKKELGQEKGQIPETIKDGVTGNFSRPRPSKTGSNRQSIVNVDWRQSWREAMDDQGHLSALPRVPSVRGSRVHRKKSFSWPKQRAMA